MIHLGVNIDHVATLRNARGGIEPSPLFAAECAVLGGADSITVHLREDRRHILDNDVTLLKEGLSVPLNLEMSVSEDIVEFGLALEPYQVTLVPERREEQTTESGLDVIRNLKEITAISEKFRAKSVRVSLFVDPDLTQLQAVLKTSSRCVELHTGAYSNAKSHAEKEKELKRLVDAALWCNNHGVRLHAGHGLNYHNTFDILQLPGIRELNIGHSIISRSVFVGLKKAVSDMRALMNQASTHEVIEKARALQQDNK
ncbi:MAG: pyridoxine 5'-phosphate synthase [Planctomycetes bacterium]|nr:pyridoxine 5'-phosphate synthase [Planctomycetota bacterium]